MRARSLAPGTIASLCGLVLGALIFCAPALAAAPEAVTGEASKMGATSVTLGGTVNPGGEPVTECQFEYGTDTSYGHTAACASDPGSGSSPVEVTADVSGLEQNTAYHFRLVAANASETGTGEDVEFVTPGPPTVDFEWSSSPSRTGDTLNANVNPMRSATTYYFEYGSVDCSAGPCARASSIDGDLGSGYGDVIASQPLAGLTPDTTYHYRVVVENANGTTYGPDRVLRTFGEVPVGLPDNRAYEMVSPVDKNGGYISGQPSQAQAANDGNAIMFTSSVGFSDVRSNILTPQYIGERNPNGWSTHAVLPDQEPYAPGAPPSSGLLAGEAKYIYMSPDLSAGVLLAHYPIGAVPPNVRSASNLYLRNDLLTQGSGEYQLLTDSVNPLDQFSSGYLTVEGASVDFSQVIFRSSADLTSDASGSETKLYEVDHGVLRLASILPDGTLAPASEGASPGHSVMSSDGSKVYFVSINSYSSNGNPLGGHIYVRENHSVTRQLDVSERGVPQNPTSSLAQLWAITPDGSKAFFTSNEELTNGDSNGECVLETPKEGTCLDLYEYDANAAAGKHLTLLSTGIGAGSVNGVMGASRDGSYVYFTRYIGFPQSGEATGAWAIYMAHDATVSFIGRIEGGYSCCDHFQPIYTELQPTYRVTAGGQLLYTTVSQQTEYNPHSVTSFCFFGSVLVDPVHGDGCDEVYIYDPGIGHMICVSCNRTDAAPTLNASFTDTVQGVFGGFITGALAHAVTDDGSMVFFDSPDALVPQDTNGHQDVYEWEKNGVGGCSQTEGCISLISTGQCSCTSLFVDADPDGKNVFFTTTQKLVRLDTDTLRDMYDARVGGGIASQNALPVPQCQGESCQSAVTPLNDATPSSATYSGPGNPTVPPPKATVRRSKVKSKACKKGLVRKHGKCVRDRRQKRTRVHSRSAKPSTNRRG